MLNTQKRKEKSLAEEKEGKETAASVRKGLSVNQRFPRRARVIATGQRTLGMKGRHRGEETREDLNER